MNHTAKNHEELKMREEEGEMEESDE